MEKPWVIIASACNISPYVISAHSTRTDAERQLIWLKRRLKRMTFSLVCKQ